MAARTKRLQQANARLEEVVERRRRTEATLRDALAQGQEDIRYRDFLIREVDHRTKNALQLAISLLSVQARHVVALRHLIRLICLTGHHGQHRD